MGVTPDPSGVLDGEWELIETVDEELAEGLGVTVHTRRRLYENVALRERVRGATGVDTLWWAVFSNELAIEPRPPDRLLDPIRKRIAVPEARRRLQATLEERGFVDVTYRDDRQVALGPDRRGTALQFSAAVVVDGTTVPIDATLIAWSDDGIALGGGIYPAATDGRVPGSDERLFDAPGTYRDRTIEFVRTLV